MKFIVKLGLNGKYRALKWRFLSQESAERWVSKFYPTRGYIIEPICD